MTSITDRFRGWRRGLKAKLPYVRRREYRVLQAKYSALVEAIDGGASLASQARLHVVKPITPVLDGEVCLFVSYASQAELKAHVRSHIEHLLASGIQVILIINTEQPPTDMKWDNHLCQQLSGILVRQNTGFDFGAWAHVMSICPGLPGWSRLFLINDSIVGPLNTQHFEDLISNVRQSTADVVGLTEALSPTRHLQSYFLAFNTSALQSAVPQRVFENVLNLQTKTQVIDVYETRLTSQLQRGGLRCVALFPTRAGAHAEVDDTSRHWQELLQRGFPYIKARVLDQLRPEQRLQLTLAAAKQPRLDTPR